MTAGLGAEPHVVGDHVRRVAALDDADVARADMSPLDDLSVPAVLHQVGNRQRRRLRSRSLPRPARRRRGSPGRATSIVIR